MMKLPDFSYLEENVKNSLFLVWLSCRDFNRLRKEENYTLLETVWRDLKNSLYQYFTNQSVKLDEIIRDFDKITLTMNPTIPFGYDYGRSVPLSHLWTFLFDSCGEYAVPPFPAKLGGELVYQHDIFLSLKAHGIIGKPKKVQKAFRVKYDTEIQKHAVAAQIAFLEKCKSNELLPFILDLVKVTAWSRDGHPFLDPHCTVSMISKPTTVALIDDLIKQDSQTLELITNEENYSEVTDETNFQSTSDIAKALSLPIKLKAAKATYPEITLDL